jgi:hypothetical protein
LLANINSLTPLQQAKRIAFIIASEGNRIAHEKEKNPERWKKVCEQVETDFQQQQLDFAIAFRNVAKRFKLKTRIVVVEFGEEKQFGILIENVAFFYSTRGVQMHQWKTCCVRGNLKLVSGFTEEEPYKTY